MGNTQISTLVAYLVYIKGLMNYLRGMRAY